MCRKGAIFKGGGVNVAGVVIYLVALMNIIFPFVHFLPFHFQDSPLFVVGHWEHWVFN